LEFLAQQAQVDRAENPSWALVFESHVVGGINIRFDANYSDAAMGWSVAPRLWGRGFATEAARVVIDAAFRAHLTLQRIAAAAHPENLASFRVMEKIGMHRQGAQQNARLSRGASADQARYLLRSDWESRT
jgi:RimJ/RimL family protein N-acetyltransferase